MNNRKIFTATFILFAFATFSQTDSDGIVRGKSIQNETYTALKPVDSKPAVFNSQDELNSKMQSKKENMIALIKANESDPIKVKYYREELWRFENAIVQPPKKK